jgi:hypothetical protein
MKILDDGTRVGESTEERRRLDRELQDLFDELEYRTLVGDWRPGNPEPIGVFRAPLLSHVDAKYCAHLDWMRRLMDSCRRIPHTFLDPPETP